MSVTGFSLGGGLSWFGRAHGPAGNAVRALEVVGADGAPSRVTAESDPDLFWALHGAGGDFAVVTALEMDLFPAPHLYGGQVIWPIARAEQVMAAYREITAAAPEELSVLFALMQFPPLPFVPEPLRGLAAVKVECAFLRDADTGRALLRGELLTDLDDAAVATLLDAAGRVPPGGAGQAPRHQAPPRPAGDLPLNFPVPA